MRTAVFATASLALLAWVQPVGAETVKFQIKGAY